jgi:hypothetical protein
MYPTVTQPRFARGRSVERNGPVRYAHRHGLLAPDPGGHCGRSPERAARVGRADVQSARAIVVRRSTHTLFSG